MNGARVLIVEDERITAFELRLALAKLGYIVVGTVARGDEAIERAQTLRPDIVLMDINIEGPVNGFEAAEHIVDQLRIPIVFLTAYANDNIVERALAIRPFGYLVKPYETRELHTTLQVALARRVHEPTPARREETTERRTGDGGPWQRANTEEAARDSAAGSPVVASLGDDLEGALDASEFELHYLPTVSLDDGSIVGIEALLRWNHPDHGCIGPDRFLPLAEARGLMDAIGRWVLRRACADVAQLMFDINRPLRLAVNVAARQLAAESLARVVLDALLDASLPAELLQLEFTENALASVECSDQRLSNLRDLGVNLCIDDFGSGRSALGRLKQLPIGRIKIDRSFIARLPGDASDIATVASMTAMSHTLDLQVTAEGVASEAQIRLVRQLGCEDAQGFAFSRALPLQGLRQLFARPVPWSLPDLGATPGMIAEAERLYQSTRHPVQ